MSNNTTARSVAKSQPIKESKKIQHKVKEIAVYEYEMIGSKPKRHLMGNSQATIFDKESRKLRVIRYCPQENSIYKDEQNEIAETSGIIFDNGRLFVPSEKPNLIAFLNAHPDNEANGGKKFRLVDGRKAKQQEIEQDFMYADAIVLLRSKTFDELLSVALALSIDIEREADEIKHDLMMFAKKNPSKFVNSFDNPFIKVKSNLLNAMNYGIIKDIGDAILWADTDKQIIAIPAGKDSIDTFTRYCMTEDGSVVYSEINNQLGQ